MATGIDVRDGRTHQQTATIATSGGAMAVDPQNRRLYVGQVVSPTEHDAAVFVVDTATNQVVANVRVDGLVDAVAVVPTGHTVYVANTERGTVSVIDGGNNTLSKTIKVNNRPRTLGVDASNDFVYVGHSDKAELLEVIDGHTGAVTASIETARSAFAMAVNSQTHTAYVENSDDEQGRGVVGSISVIAPRP
jgi:YVTN family beta-propeller protein